MANKEFDPGKKTYYMRVCALLLFFFSLACTAQAQVLPAFGDDRAGTSGFQFLKVPVDPRGAALGGTVVADAADASALFWNPALAAQSSGPQLGLASAAYFADVSLHYAAGYTRVDTPVGPLTLGLGLQALDSGEMDVTTEFSGAEGTGQTFRLVDVAAGLTVAQALTDLFSYGVTAKYVRESAADVAVATGLLDLGVFYRVGGTGVQIGVAIRNFGFEIDPGGEIERTTLGGTVTETEFEGIEPPTTFLLGTSYRPFRSMGAHDLVLSGQLTNPNDNAERFTVGAEYTWNRLLALRTGYRFGLEEASLPSLGVGLEVPGIGPALRIDYSFDRLDRLGSVHRVGLNVGISDGR